MMEDRNARIARELVRLAKMVAAMDPAEREEYMEEIRYVNSMMDRIGRALEQDGWQKDDAFNYRELAYTLGKYSISVKLTRND